MTDVAGQPGSTGGAGPGFPPAGWYPDPQVPGFLRFWNGAAWTGHSAAPVAGAVPALQSPAGWGPYSSGLVAQPWTRVDNTMGWLLACAPLLLICVDSLLLVSGLVDAENVWPVLALSAAVNTSLAVADGRALARSGVQAPSVVWALLLVPVYLVLRAVRVRGTVLIPVLWLVTFLVAMLTSAVVVESISDSPGLQQVGHYAAE